MSSAALYGIGAIAAAIFLLGRKSAGDGGTNLSVPFFNPDAAGGYAQPEAGVQPMYDTKKALSFDTSPKIQEAMYAYNNPVSMGARGTPISASLTGRTLEASNYGDRGVYFTQPKKSPTGNVRGFGMIPTDIGGFDPALEKQQLATAKKAEAPAALAGASAPIVSSVQGGAIVYTQASKKSSNNFTGTTGRTYRG